MKTLLVFAHECAPYHRRESTIGAQRPAQLAKHLPAFGWRAVVVCCDAARRGTATRRDRAAVEAEVRARLRSAAPDESVILPTPALAWDGPLDRAWQAAAAPGGGRWRAAVRRPLTAAKLLTGDYSQPWQPCARQAAEVVAEEMRVDACLAEHSPDAGLFLARWFARRAGVPWIADFRDPILRSFTPLGRRLYRPLARRLVASAAATVAVLPVWAQDDRTLFGRPAWTIPNGYDPDEWTDVPALPSDHRLTVTYTGNILIPHTFEVFLAGLRLARARLGADSGLLFRYRGLWAETVARRIAALGLDDVADVAGYCPRDEALALLRSSDLLLLLSCTDPGDPYLAHGLYPGKVFECFGACRPILCVPGDREQGAENGELDSLLAATRTGTVAATPEAVAEILIAARAQRERGEEIPYHPDEAVLARYTRRALAGQLAELLDEVTAITSGDRDVRHRRPARG
jgi:glycosyltransferase involved in cell wall biosynthesis